MPTAQRRDQIVEATLELLAHTSIEALTTRKIAQHLGLSQPALFRHFRSRGALLVAVVEHSRARLEGLASEVLDTPGGPTAQLQRLVTGLLAHVSSHPGLPRLLFSDGLLSEDVLGTRLRQLSSMQIALVTELVRQGQQAGELSGALDARQAATVLIGMIQGITVQWLLAGRSAGLVDGAGALLSHWLHGAAASSTTPVPAAAPSPTAATVGIATIDVRPILAGGDDPLDAILAALDTVAPSGVLIVSAPFRPTPLIALLGKKGHHVTANEVPAGWSVHVVVGGAIAIEDLRDHPPPEPLERVLEACNDLAAGEVYLAQLPRFPKLLLPQLAARGVVWQLETIEDGSALLRIVGGR